MTNRRAERGFKRVLTVFDNDGDADRFPSADPASDNESNSADGVCPTGTRVILESVTCLAGAGTLQVKNGDGSSTYFNVFVDSAGPAKILGVELTDGLGIASVAGNSGDSIIALYSVIG